MQNLYMGNELSCESWRSSVVEQLTCNQQVGGSNPFASSTLKVQDTRCRIHDTGYKMRNPSCIMYRASCIVTRGEVAEWTKAADCKSAGVSLRRFESFPPHHILSFRSRNADCGMREILLATEVTENIEKGFLNKLFMNSVFSVANNILNSAGVAQLVRASAFQAEGRGFESRLPLIAFFAHVAQSVEHILGKDEVSGSSPLVGSMLCMTTCSLIH